jgi:hypothetical protein
VQKYAVLITLDLQKLVIFFQKKIKKIILKIKMRKRIIEENL